MVEAQNAPAPAAPSAEAPAPASPPTDAQTPPPASQRLDQTAKFTREELRKLLMPIALFPDPLLAQLLPASAYPVEIVQAERWLDANKELVAKNDFSGIDKQDWDPAVKAMARFPDVIRKMSADLAWTTDPGDAIVNQPRDVADVIQEPRSEAEKSGSLKTTAQQTVKRVGSSTPQGERSVIAIQPTDPSTIYVPSYDPNAVYGATSVVAPLLTFGTGIALGALATGTGTGEPERPIRPLGPDTPVGGRPMQAGGRARRSTTATSTSATTSMSATAIGPGVRTATTALAKAASPGSAIAREVPAAPAAPASPAELEVRAALAGPAASAVQENPAASAGPVGPAGRATDPEQELVRAEVVQAARVPQPVLPDDRAARLGPRPALLAPGQAEKSTAAHAPAASLAARALEAFMAEA